MTGWLQKASCIRGTGQDPRTIGLGITGRPERLVHSEPRNIFWGRVIHRGTDTNATDYILYAERPLARLISVAWPTPATAPTPTPERHRGLPLPSFLFATPPLGIRAPAMRSRW